RPRAILRGHTKEVRALAFTPDGSRLASAGDDGTVRLWAPAAPKKDARVLQHPKDVRTFSLAFSPGGGLLGCGCNDGRVRLWDTARTTVRELAGHNERVSAIAFLPEPKKSGEPVQFVTGGVDGTVRLWDVARGKSPTVEVGHLRDVTSLQFAP